MGDSEAAEPLTFTVPPFTPEEMARALDQVAWKHKLMKQLHAALGGPEVHKIEFPDESDQPHIIGPSQ